jgi:hypothetical protein
MLLCVTEFVRTNLFVFMGISEWKYLLNADFVRPFPLVSA